jgi:hypothetical protein
MKSSIENSNLPENARSPVSSESRRSRPNSATPISDERADRSPPITTGAGAEKSWRCRAWSDGRDWAGGAQARRNLLTGVGYQHDAPSGRTLASPLSS